MAKIRAVHLSVHRKQIQSMHAWINASKKRTNQQTWRVGKLKPIVYVHTGRNKNNFGGGHDYGGATICTPQTHSIIATWVYWFHNKQIKSLHTKSCHRKHLGGELTHHWVLNLSCSSCRYNRSSTSIEVHYSAFPITNQLEFICILWLSLLFTIRSISVVMKKHADNWDGTFGPTLTGNPIGV
jgi:hypothetical protein